MQCANAYNWKYFVVIVLFMTSWLMTNVQLMLHNNFSVQTSFYYENIVLQLFCIFFWLSFRQRHKFSWFNFPVPTIFLGFSLLWQFVLLWKNGRHRHLFFLWFAKDKTHTLHNSTPTQKKTLSNQKLWKDKDRVKFPFTILFAFIWWILFSIFIPLYFVPVFCNLSKTE